MMENREFSAAAWMPADQIGKAFHSPNFIDRIFAGSINLKEERVHLLRGNGEILEAPFSFFNPSGDGLSPDFAKFSIDDYGCSIVFGEYEASTDAILYEYAPDYRERVDNLARQD